MQSEAEFTSFDMKVKTRRGVKGNYMSLAIDYCTVYFDFKMKQVAVYMTYALRIRSRLFRNKTIVFEIFLANNSL